MDGRIIERLKKRVGTRNDALYYQAMVLYCKANFGYDENTERFQTAFEKLRDSMALSGDYAKEKKNGNGGTDLGENL